MGQINSAQDGSAAKNVPMSNNSKNPEADNENLSEKVRCVKTRIDMLIEDCLNTNENHQSENSESNVTTEQKSDHSFGDDKQLNPVTSTETSGTKEEVATKTESKDEDKNTVTTSLGCTNENDSSVKNSETGTYNSKLDLSDLIQDSVNTELTQKQLRQIQQRTITTFNTFIDKVLDNSLKKEIVKTETPNNSNILKLCSESMNSEPETSSEKKVTNKNKLEPSVNNSDSNSESKTTGKSITLKEHIERFLEISFREGIFEDDKMPENKVTLPQNFNAQGLVNSMITQGLQIDRILTKEKPNSASHKMTSQKDHEDKPSGRILRVSEPRPPVLNNQGQKSPGMRSYSDVNDRRSSHDVASHHITETRLHEQYLNNTKSDQSQRMGGHSGYRMDEMMERNRELQQAKMPFDGMGINSGARPPGHMSSFHHPHHPQMGNNAYLHPAYGPRMQLSPGRREIRSPVSRDSKNHPRDCGCPYCMQMMQSCQNLDIPIPDHHGEKHSPIMSHALFDHGMSVQTAMAGHLREVPVSMMKPVSEMSPAMPGYHGMHRLMPHNPPITSSKVLNSAPHLVTVEVPPQTMMDGRRHGLHETSSYYFSQRPGDDISPAERAAVRSGKRSPYQIRPSSLPSQEHNSRPASGHRSNDSEFIRSSDSLSGASDCSNEAPLDLTVKKSKVESMRNRSASNSSSGRKINPSVTFIKRLESSVDKHWQELSYSPPSSPVQPQMTINRPVTPNNRNHSHLYPRQSSSGSPPASMITMLSNRQLRSPHYMGGITVGQPLVDMKSQVTQKHNENKYNNVHQSAPPMTIAQAQSQQHFQVNQSNVDINSKRNSSNNISKHEPIQNIIGNNDPNDILYLICRLCTQTYGSPYGFRKHFRNQHGFEPRAEHTIVQTISATKTALHLPQQQTVLGVTNIHESHRIRKSMSPEDSNESSRISVGGSTGRRDSPASPADSRSIAGSEEGEKCDIENSETKCLECPECGKTFQLNDFGSYKRHCRQHGSVKMNGPFTCSDCHLPFPDQKLLREHYILHVKEGPLAKQEKAGTDVINQKHEKSLMKCYSCVKCNVQFDNIDVYTNHMNRHSSDSQGSGRDRSNSLKSEQKLTLSVKSEKDSFSNIITSTNITIQAAESMTSSVCPDSSWDNVAKVVATSDKMESTTAELSESNHSSVSNCSEQHAVKNESKNGSNSPSVNCSQQKSMEPESDTSEDKAGGTDEYMYIHKKFFHHRKRANSNINVEATEPKQTKLSSEYTGSSSEDLNGNSSGVTNICDSVAATSTKPPENQGGKSQVEIIEKLVKTEARHSSLPFVLDRTVRSQRK